MDEIVRQAIAKWPNVPHCFGWLGLDARGNWRMRDEAAQHQQQPGDKIRHAALLGFINRNYQSDPQGRWYFQNGPQRVYVNLEATPYIAHTDPLHDVVLHTGEAITTIDAAWLTEQGRLLVRTEGRIAQLDDRDTSHWLTWLQKDGIVASDADLLHWLDHPDYALTLTYRQQQVVINSARSDALPQLFGYVQLPQPDPAG